jgi:hypothetical protein
MSSAMTAPDFESAPGMDLAMTMSTPETPVKTVF